MNTNVLTRTPYLIDFAKIGASDLGYISVAEKECLPFQVKRVYWTYYTPESVKRGGHAHYDLDQILVAVAGTIVVTTESPAGEVRTFRMKTPEKGLFLPACYWRNMKYSHNAVQLCLASKEFDAGNYIRDYKEFKRYYANGNL